MTTLNKEIKRAREYNFVTEVMIRCDELAQEHSDDIDLMINILNGSIVERAKEQIEFEKSIGMRDNMYILE